MAALRRVAAAVSADGEAAALGGRGAPSLSRQRHTAPPPPAFDYAGAAAQTAALRAERQRHAARVHANSMRAADARVRGSTSPYIHRGGAAFMGRGEAAASAVSDETRYFADRMGDLPPEVFDKTIGLDDNGVGATGTYRLGTHILPVGPFRYPYRFKGHPQPPVTPDNRDMWYWGHNPNSRGERLLDWVMILSTAGFGAYFFFTGVFWQSGWHEPVQELSPEGLLEYMARTDAATTAARGKA